MSENKDVPVVSSVDSEVKNQPSAFQSLDDTFANLEDMSSQDQNLDEQKRSSRIREIQSLRRSIRFALNQFRKNPAYADWPDEANSPESLGELEVKTTALSKDETVGNAHDEATQTIRIVLKSLGVPPEEVIDKEIMGHLGEEIADHKYPGRWDGSWGTSHVLPHGQQEWQSGSFIPTNIHGITVGVSHIREIGVEQKEPYSAETRFYIFATGKSIREAMSGPDLPPLPPKK